MNWNRSIAYLKRKLPESSTAVVSVSHEDSLVLKDLNNGLLVSYLVEEENRFSYVQNRHLLAAGVDEATLHNAAIDNLYRIAENYLKIQPYGSVFAVFMEGNFEASVLLLDTVWEISFANHVREDFVVAIPSRDVLAFADSISPKAISELQKIVDRIVSKSGDHLISKSLYRRKNMVWAPYES